MNKFLIASLACLLSTSLYAKYDPNGKGKSGLENSSPYSIINDKYTAQLTCLFEKAVLDSDPREELIKLEIVDSPSIKKLFENDNISLDLYKAFVLDYYYKSTGAEKYYINAAKKNKKHTPYYIYYLSRTNQYDLASKELRTFGLFDKTNRIDILSAAIYVAHDADVDNALLSKLNRKNITLDEIQRNFYGCK